MHWWPIFLRAFPMSWHYNLTKIILPPLMRQSNFASRMRGEGIMKGTVACSSNNHFLLANHRILILLGSLKLKAGGELQGMNLIDLSQSRSCSSPLLLFVLTFGRGANFWLKRCKVKCVGRGWEVSRKYIYFFPPLTKKQHWQIFFLVRNIEIYEKSFAPQSFLLVLEVTK